ncbi:efflux transporter outer membrane subunit (plasmid) [Rhizobium ruizarguesonis]|uniref:Efflux transporter outer membrane subunit n=1 Tax=Rhizobium ruizarguesonis TaxID=2081791 RepID=A0AB38HR94_9HYPH|nr:efflux transporter outer membrane subunit [Rhizobium ruizarguesonis]TAW61055.1 efflux transporter outer membrane subunit [Rhizobium ruizarguesonis]TAX01451.1 efflux transporter outer membrane subunit [Rhizobium ruizarguesonis]TAX03443.1 efflux transporter outer membrane subunit [Rhizobium ruizarguesonis]TAZ67977.1 efflux transporter outer membrane subunit [Rhizobium ruizarguesonis]TAZ88422.1 efflux transporter outer membrane subunit [Rhizobium ruizarguesonis]
MIPKSVCPLWHADIPSDPGRKARQSAVSYTTSRDTIVSVSLSWLLDLFGVYKRNTESAEAALDAEYASVDMAKLAFINDIISSYVDARYYQRRLALSQANLKSRRETFELTKSKFDAGAVARIDVVRAQGLVQSTLAEIPSLEAKFRISAHRIATLLGKPAGCMVEEIAKGSNQPAFRADVNVGIPADIIRNRPDIRKAERDLADSTAQIGVAEAKLFPSITLSGSISPSGGINERGVYGNLTPWSFGPSLNLPILDGGGLRANVEVAKSKATISYLNWKSAVLKAVEQVENALVAMHRDARTVQALKAAVETAKETLKLSTSSYKDGATSLLDLLEDQRSLSIAQASLATAIQQWAKEYVALNSAIGGGYSPVAKARF